MTGFFFCVVQLCTPQFVCLQYANMSFRLFRYLQSNPVQKNVLQDAK